MPSSPGYRRNYKQEARAESPARKRARNKRKRARRAMVKAGKVRTNDGKTVDHITPLRSGGSNSENNLRVRSASANSAAGGRAGNRKGKAAGGRKGMRKRYS